MIQQLYKLRAGISRIHKSRPLIELFYSVAAIITLIILSFSSDIEFVETLYDFTRSHEDWELDEFIFSFLWIAIIISIYAIRRVRDIIHLNKRNEYNANHDALTGLSNRQHTHHLLKEMLTNAEQHNQSVAVIFIDLNDFKNINDSFGHNYGDLLIRQIGKRLANTIKDGDVAARLGGDEFLIATPFNGDNKTLIGIIDDIKACARRPYLIYDRFIMAKFSIGVATYPIHGESVRNILTAADTAMYEAKKDKNQSTCYYTVELGERRKEYYALASSIKTALLNKDLDIDFHPIASIKSGEIEGYEALVKWNIGDTMINTESFVSIIEDIGMSDDFFRWLMETAITKSNLAHKPTQFISINVTARQFLSDSFFDIVKTSIEKRQEKTINLEITEASMLADYQEAGTRIQRLHELGVKVMIDEFGTDKSSLGRLKGIKIDKIKMDMRFLRLCDISSKNHKFFEAIFSLANALDIGVIVDGVETHEQLQQLRALSPILAKNALFQATAAKE